MSKPATGPLQAASNTQFEPFKAQKSSNCCRVTGVVIRVLALGALITAGVLIANPLAWAVIAGCAVLWLLAETVNCCYNKSARQVELQQEPRAADGTSMRVVNESGTTTEVEVIIPPEVIAAANTEFPDWLNLPQ